MWRTSGGGMTGTAGQRVEWETVSGREQNAVRRDSRRWEQKPTKGTVGKSSSGTKYHTAFPLPSRSVPVPTTFSCADFYRACLRERKGPDYTWEHSARACRSESPNQCPYWRKRKKKDGCHAIAMDTNCRAWDSTKPARTATAC